MWQKTSANSLAALCQKIDKFFVRPGLPTPMPLSFRALLGDE